MLITIKDFCQKYKISRRTIYNYIGQGLPYVRIGIRNIRLEEDKVLDWLKEKGKEVEKK